MTGKKGAANQSSGRRAFGKKAAAKKPAAKKQTAKKQTMVKSAHRRGLDAENIAALYLRCKGYRILERRFRSYAGEIDIIAKRLNTIAFVEVKFRRSHERAAEAIDRINQSRVRRAAELYLMKHTEYTVLELRFDALVMAPGRLPQHITDAF